MNRTEINEKIALLLGFEKVPYLDRFQWVYPPEFNYMRVEVPEWYCPDFLQIIENHRKISDLAYKSPKDRNSSNGPA